MTGISNFKVPWIAVPLNSISTEKLYRRELEDIHCKRFSLDRGQLYKIFATGFFDYLNDKYRLSIGDYEEEEIVGAATLLMILNYDLKDFRNLKHSFFWDNFE